MSRSQRTLASPRAPWVAPNSTAFAPSPPVDLRAAAPTVRVLRRRTPLVVQVDFAPGRGYSKGTGVLLDGNSIAPALRVPAAPGDETSYVLTVKHGLPTDLYGEVLHRVEDISVLMPREAGRGQPRPVRGTVTAVRVSGSSDLALLIVRGRRADPGSLAGSRGVRVALSDPPVGTPVDYIGVNPTGDTVARSGRVLTGPTNMSLGRYFGQRWGNPVTTTIPPQTPGNSGGPLLDRNGEVVGVLSGSGRGAAPSDSVTYFASAGDLRRFLRDPRDSATAALPSQHIRVLFPRTYPGPTVDW